jgi:agmatinase
MAVDGPAFANPPSFMGVPFSRDLSASRAAVVGVPFDCGTISLPHMRALHRRHDGLVVLHIDAHTDTYPSYGSGVRDRYNTATTFTRAAEEGVIDAAGSCHLGARGPVYTDGVFEFTRQQGYRLITGEELFHRGFGDVVTELHRHLAQRPVYLCFDMDFFDPSCAPGVCTPTWGGPSAREGLGLIRSLAGLRFVGFEVNTVSPPHDVGGMTAFLAAEVVRQFLLWRANLRSSAQRSDRSQCHG